MVIAVDTVHAIGTHASPDEDTVDARAATADTAASGERTRATRT